MFRKLVAERVNEYKTLQNKGDRPGTLRLVRTVIDQVKNRGGRFLDKNWKNEVRKQNATYLLRDAMVGSFLCIWLLFGHTLTNNGLLFIVSLFPNNGFPKKTVGRNVGKRKHRQGRPGLAGCQSQRGQADARIVFHPDAIDR
jgi:hypothetical protein